MRTLMKKTRIWIAVLAGIMVLTSAASVFAAEAKNGWSGNYYYVNGAKVTGFKKIGGKGYVFDSKGKLVKDRYAYRLKVKKNSYKYYNITKKGVATQWKSTAAKAAEVLSSLDKNKNTITTKKREKYLKKGFHWAANEIRYLNNEKSGMSASKAAKYYGNAAFDDQKGDCDTQAYAIYWMAKVLGYQPKYMRGYIKATSGLRPYAWCQIKIGKTNYVFDATLNSAKNGNGERYTKVYKDEYLGYKKKYGQKPGYTYYDKDQKELTD